MASPPEVTTLDLTGKFIMNKTLSDDTDEVLTLQGIGWITRKAIAFATLTLDVKHYKGPAEKDGPGPEFEHIDIDQTLTGGMKGTSEARVLDWTERVHEDYLFGKCAGKSRRLPLADVEDEFLKTGFTKDVEEHGAIESFVVNDANHWSAHQIWGFEEIDGKRYYVRHLKFETPTKKINRRLVYDRASS